MITVSEIEASGGYSVIYADPPWSYTDAKPNGGAAKHYDTMPLIDIMALPVARIAAKDSLLFLWGTFPQTPEALAVMDAWGFKFKTIAFAWVKTAPGGLAFGLGRYTRGNVEPCWLGVRGSPYSMIKSHSVRQVIETASDAPEVLVAPRGVHSAKPACARDRIVELVEADTRLEMFARARTPGWDVFGNEVISDLDMRGDWT